MISLRAVVTFYRGRSWPDGAIATVPAKRRVDTQDRAARTKALFSRSVGDPPPGLRLATR